MVQLNLYTSDSTFCLYTSTEKKKKKKRILQNLEDNSWLLKWAVNLVPCKQQTDKASI